MRKQTKGGKDGAMPTQITVTVTPGNPNSNNEVACRLHVAPPRYLVDDAIWLDPGQDYDIRFNLTAANGVNDWHAAPFGNQAGTACPDASAGPNGPFGRGPAGGGGGVPPFMTVNVRNGSRSVNSYRLNFNDGYFCDPIIIIG